MKSFKQLLKRKLPKPMLELVIKYYHLLRAVAASAINGFPARKLNVIAITGTNGKTTTSAMLASILEEEGYKVGVSSTAFFKIGEETHINDLNMTVINPFKLQRLLRKMDNAHVDIVILEVTSHALLQSRVWGIKPICAIMTNLSQDHLDYHKTMDSYAEAKGRLFAMRPPFIILNHDDEWYDFFDQFSASDRKFSYGASVTADIRLTSAKLKPSSSKLTIGFDDNELEVTTNMTGKFNAYNALAAASAAHALEVEPENIATGLKKLESVAGRMEPVEAGQGFNIYIDYAHTPDALSNVLETLDSIVKGKIITVFGATGDRDQTKRPIMGSIVSELSDIAIITDDEPYSENPEQIRLEVQLGFEDSDYECEVYNIADRREAIEKALKIAKKDDIVLFAGMGHQTYRVIGDERHSWNEREIIESILKH